MEKTQTVPPDQRHVVADGDAPQPRATRRLLSFALGLVVSVFFLYLALRGVNAGQLRRELQAARFTLLILAVAVGSITCIIRAVRWRILLGKRQQATLRPLFTSMMIGYLANNLLPARAGELVRIYVLERRTGMSKSTSAATVILERLTDALVLLALIGVLSFFVPLPALIRDGSRIAAAGCFVVALFLLYIAARGHKLAYRLTHRVEAISPKIGQKLEKLFLLFADGLGVLRSGRHLISVLTLTLLVWAIEAVSVTLVISSLGLSLPRIAAVFILVVISLSALIPTAPGAVGTYEFFTVAALTPFAVGGNRAVGLALALHAVNYVTVTLLGVLSLSAESLSWRELTGNTRNP